MSLRSTSSTTAAGAASGGARAEPSRVVVVSRVRELLGFIRAVVREVTPYQERVAEVGRARCTGALDPLVIM